MSGWALDAFGYITAIKLQNLWGSANLGVPLSGSWSSSPCGAMAVTPAQAEIPFWGDCPSFSRGLHLAVPSLSS